MIHYQLRCDASHEFEGWFKNSAGFDEQSRNGLIACPVCAGTSIRRALMAPSLPRKNRSAKAESPPPSSRPLPVTQTAAQAIPDAVRAALHKLRHEVEQNCDYVGPQFAEEARKIHNGVAPARAIYGETTPDQAEALTDDGIEISSIPWLPRADS